MNKFDVILIAPHIPHTYISSFSWKLLWIHFPLSPDVLNSLAWKENISGLRLMTLPPNLFMTSKFLLQEANTLNISRQRSWFPLSIRLIEAALLRIDAIASERGDTLPQWVSLAMEQLNDIENNVRMDDIARKFGLSRASFYNEFRKLTGYTPGSYREQRRLRHAEQLLLQTGISISEIAFQCGYENPLYFSLRFRKYYDCSPRTYRNKDSTRKAWKNP